MTRNAILIGLCAAAILVSPVFALDRVSASEKGSFLVYSKVELRWEMPSGNLIQDTFLDMSNDYPGFVAVQLYFVNGDDPAEAVYDGGGTLIERAHFGCNWVDNAIALTGNEPAFWSALTGQEKGVSPFTVLDPAAGPFNIADPLTWPGRPAPDGSGDRVLRGFVLAWAIDANGEEIRWNHLKGDALIINYSDAAAWEYNAYAFQATETVAHGAQTGTPGILNLNGVEYDYCFDLLLMDFYAVGSTGLNYNGHTIDVDVDLTLLPMTIDVRQDSNGWVKTKAKFDIWNQNEVKFSNTEWCIKKWDQRLLSDGGIPAPNSFYRFFLGTNKGKARIDGMASSVCPDSIDTPLLGVRALILDFTAGADTAMAGINLVGMGTQTGCVHYDLLAPPPELFPTTVPVVAPVKGVKASIR
ncbi:MAG TPA: hypothetical protein PKK06_11650 [Phycisphaerae bacterium]|nr:hypothetical protein [Phycisphaerae bacterium]HNU45884.1 hypothetical protein [Phycisphaerae bacterium]